MSTQLAAVPDPVTATDFASDYLTRGRHLVKAGESTAWELGDYILEAFPFGDHGVKTGVAAGLRALAAEIAGEPDALTAFRKVAHSWPEGSRLPSASWAAHQAYMGPPSEAPARRRVLESLPRNEHGMVTKQAVRNMTKGNTGGKPGWHELLGRVGDAITDGQKHMEKVDAEVDREPGDPFKEKAREYAARADALAASLRAICDEWEAVT